MGGLQPLRSYYLRFFTRGTFEHPLILMRDVSLDIFVFEQNAHPFRHNYSACFLAASEGLCGHA
jgi:hypothetical protein